MLKKLSYFIIGVIICCILILSYGKAEVKYTVSDKRKAVVETAEAYLKKGRYYQYDNYRENKYSSPEEANSNNNVYAVCSSFINQIYYNSFKLTSMPYLSTNFIEYAKKYHETKINQYSEGSEDNKADGKYILKYYDTVPKFTNLEQVIKDWSTFLQQGDIIIVNYKYINNMGHTIMVYDVDKTNHKVTIIENNGKTYDINTYIDSYEENGSISKHDLYDYFKKFYISSEGAPLIKQLAIVRYITDDNKYLSTAGNELTLGMNTAAITRLKYPKMNITKSASVSNKDGNKLGSMNVNLEDTITYTISIQNNSNIDYNNLIVYEYPDSVVTVLDNLNNYSDNKLSWNISRIKAGENYTIKYKVSVPNNQSLTGKVIHSTGKVGNILNTDIYLYVGNSLPSKDKAKLYEIYQNNNSLSDLNYINYIYKQIGYDINLNNIDLKDIIEYQNDNSLLVKNTKIKESNVSKMIFGNYYGLAVAANDDVNGQKIHAWKAWRNRKDDMTVQTVDTKEVMANHANRAKTINKNMLEIGDIIIVKTAGVQKSYVYINDSLLVRKNQNGTFENYTDKNLDIFLRDLVGKNYVIIRPALSQSKNIKEPDNEKKDNEITNNNDKKDNETVSNNDKKGNETTNDNNKKDSEITNNNDKKDNETNNNETKKKDNKSDKKQDTNNSKTPNLIYIYIFDLFAIILLAVIIRKSKTSK